MSADKGYGPFRDPSIPSLGETLALFESLPDETSSRKARVRAQVFSLARLMKKTPAEIPAQPNFVMHEFARLKKQPTGLSAKSLANCKSEIRYLMKKCRTPTGRSRFRPLLPEWEELRDRLVNDKATERLYWKVSRAAAFCSAIGVLPSALNDDVVEQFRIALTDTGEVAKPNQKVRDAIRAWNAVAAMDRSLPCLSLAPRAVPRWTIPPEEFPQSLQDDVAQWLASRTEIDPEGEEGPIRPLRAASLESYRHLVFKAATALVQSGRPIESVTSMACLVEIDAFKVILKFLRERQGGEPKQALLGLATLLTSIARHKEKLGDAHVGRMSRICKNYNVEDRPTKTQERLKAFEDEKLLARILHFPQGLIEEAESTKKPILAKILAQVAIALEIEWQSPFRIKNLNMMRFGEHIQPITVAGQPRWIVRFESDDVKNHKQLVFEIPTASVRFIERALRLCEPKNAYLFPGTKGSCKSEGLLAKQVKQAVEKRLGVPFNIHMMCGLVATTELKEGEGNFEQVRAVLGDSTDRVIRKHYTSTAEQHLIRRAQNTLQKVRQRTAAMVPSPKKTKKAA